MPLLSENGGLGQDTVSNPESDSEWSTEVEEDEHDEDSDEDFEDFGDFGDGGYSFSDMPDSLGDFLANLDANGVEPPGGFPRPPDGWPIITPRDFMQITPTPEMRNLWPGQHIDFDTPKYSNFGRSAMIDSCSCFTGNLPDDQKRMQAITRFSLDKSDYLAISAMDPVWLKRAKRAFERGERAEFMRAERATWNRMMDEHDRRFRLEYPDIAADLEQTRKRSDYIMPIRTAELDRNACWHCMKDKEEVGPLMTCSKCKAAKYCTTYCQKAAWKKHKPECLAAA